MKRACWVSSTPTLCPVCGYRVGCMSRDLTPGEAGALRRLGYLLTTNVFGEDIAAPPPSKTRYPSHYSAALFHYHRAGHPAPPPTAFERIAAEFEGETG